MATRKKAPAKKKAGKPRPPKPKSKEQPPIRIIVEVVVRIEGNNAYIDNTTSKGLKTLADALPFNVAGFDESKIEKDVKEFILVNSPKNGDIDISDIEDGLKLKENLDYQADDYDTLQLDLDKYVNDQKDDEHVTEADVTNNKTVGKIIEMVKEKLN